MKKLILLSVFTFTLIFTPLVSTQAFAQDVNTSQKNKVHNLLPALGATLGLTKSHSSNGSASTNDNSSTSQSAPRDTETLTQTTVNDQNTGIDSESNDTTQDNSDNNNDGNLSDQPTSPPTSDETNCSTKAPVFTPTSDPSTNDQTTIPGGTVSFDTSCGSGTAQFVYEYQYKSVDLYSSTVHTETRYINIPRIVTVIDHVAAPQTSLPLQAASNKENTPTTVASEKNSHPLDGFSVTAMFTGLGSLFLYGLRKKLVSPFL